MSIIKLCEGRTLRSASSKRCGTKARDRFSAFHIARFTSFTVSTRAPTYLIGCALRLDSRETYHSRWVSARSGSGKPLNRECRALARATSASLTTRKPLGFRTEQPLGPARPRRSVRHDERRVDRRSKHTNKCVFGVTDGKRRRPSCSILRPKSELSVMPTVQRESRYRAVSNDRTYRRSETEQKRQNELKGNRGERLKDSQQGKSWSVSESKGNSSQTELNLREEKRMCSKCGINPDYMGTGWCEPCLYELVQNQ